MNPFVNPWVVIGLLVAWIATGAYAFYKGYEAADDKAKIASQALIISGFKSEIETLRKAADVNESAAEAWQIQAQQNEQELTQAEKDLEELKNAWANLPPPAPECLYTPADIKRMLGRGGKASGSGGGRTAPAARDVPAGEGPVSKGR
jgi:hypothetical protein